MRRAFAFLSVVGRSRTPNASTLAWFPLVGTVLGLVLGVIWWLAAKAWPPTIAAAIVVAVDLILTGGLHVDGLADAGDGLIAPLSKERRLEAMADPAIGAFGVMCVVAVLLLRFGALANLREVPLMLGGLWCASRTMMVFITESFPYARPRGLVSNFLGDGTRSVVQRATIRGSMIAGLVVAGLLVVLERGGRGLIALGGELAAMLAVALFARRRIGGFTGDVLGAAGIVGETIGLLILATK